MFGGEGIKLEYFSTSDTELYPTILTFKYDVDRVTMNQRVKYPSQSLVPFKSHSLSRHTDTQTYQTNCSTGTTKTLSKNICRFLLLLLLGTTAREQLVKYVDM